MTTEPEFIENGLARLLLYSRKLWESFDEEAQEFCKSEWIRKADPLPGVEVIALKLTTLPEDFAMAAMFDLPSPEPDAIVWQHRFPPNRHSGTVEVKCCPTCRRPL